MESTLSGDSSLTLPEFDQPPTDPIELLRRWIEAAELAGVREPRAATLATADGDGRVSARTLLIKDVGPDGVIMGFAADSRKGRDLARNPYAAVNFYWRERLQQITIAGKITSGGDELSDRMFGERTRSAQAVAVVSDQSMPMPGDPSLLPAEVARLTESADPIARPDGWAAWALGIDEIEFWHGSPDRVHRRLSYVRDGQAYRAQRLQP